MQQADLEKLKRYLGLFPEEWRIDERPLGSGKKKKMINVVFDSRVQHGRSPTQIARNLSPEFAEMLVLMRKLLPGLIECAESESSNGG